MACFCCITSRASCGRLEDWRLIQLQLSQSILAVDQVPRGNTQRQRKREPGWRHIAFYNLDLEVMSHLFYQVLLVGIVVKVWSGVRGGDVALPSKEYCWYNVERLQWCKPLLDLCRSSMHGPIFLLGQWQLHRTQSRQNCGSQQRSKPRHLNPWVNTWRRATWSTSTFVGVITQSYCVSLLRLSDCSKNRILFISPNCEGAHGSLWIHSTY